MAHENHRKPSQSIVSNMTLGEHLGIRQLQLKRLKLPSNRVLDELPAKVALSFRHRSPLLSDIRENPVPGHYLPKHHNLGLVVTKKKLTLTQQQEILLEPSDPAETVPCLTPLLTAHVSHSANACSRSSGCGTRDAESLDFSERLWQFHGCKPTWLQILAESKFMIALMATLNYLVCI